MWAAPSGLVGGMTFSLEWLLEENAKAKEVWAKDADDFLLREACETRAFKCPDCGTAERQPGFAVMVQSRSPIVFCGSCGLMVAELVLEHFLLW